MKTILVTGANGFVGRQVCRVFLEQGWRVRAAMRNAAAATPPPGAAPVWIDDLATYAGWRDALLGADAVAHLAARTHCLGETSQSGREAYRATNVEGTRRLLEACGGGAVRRFVFVSSIKAVGEGASHAYRETDACRPADAYGETKREAELLTLGMANESSIAPVIVRAPLVYGVGAQGNLSRLMQWILQGRPLPLGCVRNARSMVHVENLAEAIHACVVHPSAAGEIFHVADDPPLSTRDLAVRLARAFGLRARLLPVPVSALRILGRVTGRIDFVRRLTESLVVDAGKVRRLTGWKPSVSLDAGLQAMAVAYGEAREKFHDSNSRKAA